MIAGANVFPAHLPPQPHERRDCPMIAVLIIYHPSEGLILHGTGSCEDVITSWGTQSLECTPRIWDKETNSVPAAVKATGNAIKDIKAVVVSYIPFDHAGGSSSISWAPTSRFGSMKSS